VVAAAGSSERLGGTVPKQFRPIGGIPLLLRAVRPFLSHPDVREVVAVLPSDSVAAPPAWLAELLGERLRIVAGGATRSDSVMAGLGVLPPHCSVVLVHDGARPFPSREVIDAVIRVAKAGSAATAAVPLFDTLKESADSSPRVLRTVPRANLWRTQTPQGFPRKMLERALATEGRSRATDEAQLVERLGAEVILVRDSVRNIKITTEDELGLAEALAAMQS
jgi:2-C-methyl-D-erythritol 4-phosphate cytidylyltransferase